MTPEEITAAFATAAASFQPIVGQPSDDDLTALREILYPLLLDIPYDNLPGAAVGQYQHNLVGLIEPNATYAVTWHAAFPIPARLPAYPAVPDDANANVRNRMEAIHKIKLRDYASYDAAERATAKFIRDAVDEIWYRDLRHDRSYYTTVTAKQLIDHLDANCGGLHPSELVTLPTEMMGYYATTDGIPEYINMLEEAQRKLARANLPMSDDQLLAIASTSVLASDHFPRPTDEWEARPRATKTWPEWKLHYRAAHLARKRQMLATGQQHGAANATTADNATISMETFERLDGYLDNIAAAATTERDTLKQLIDNNASLAASVKSLTGSVALLQAAYTQHIAKKPTATPTPATTPKVKVKADPNGYCWTHGYMVRESHTSVTCTNKAAGHQDAATRTNPMGGSERNK